MFQDVLKTWSVFQRVSSTLKLWLSLCCLVSRWRFDYLVRKKEKTPSTWCWAAGFISVDFVCNLLVELNRKLDLCHWILKGIKKHYGEDLTFHQTPLQWLLKNAAVSLFEFFQTFPRGILLVSRAVSHQLNVCVWGRGRGIGKAFCLGEKNLMRSAGVPSCKAALLRAKELLQFPWLLLCSVCWGVWGCPWTQIMWSHCAMSAGVVLVSSQGWTPWGSQSANLLHALQVTTFKKIKN